MSGTGLSGLDRDERVSNLLDTSREAVVSNNEVEKFGIPHRTHSQAKLKKLFVWHCLPRVSLGGSVGRLFFFFF